MCFIEPMPASRVPAKVTYEENIQLHFTSESDTLEDTIHTLKKDCIKELQSLLHTSDPLQVNITTQGLPMSTPTSVQMINCPPSLTFTATPAYLPGPIECYVKSEQRELLAYLTAQQKRHDKEIQALTGQIEQLNGERCKIATRALLDEVVNQIGSALSVRSRRQKLVSGKKTWDRKAVLKAWEAHLRKPKHLDPITATYLGDHSTVRMVLGVDAAGKQLRGDGDAAAHEFNEDQFRKYCSSTILPLDIRTQIQHSFSFLFPSAVLLDFKTL
ncbi:hypothetical protein B0H14DRAFT_3152672 [Mycena olivaceomarginata]|nr:hypothetical protein B0H14DRAFT_3152672 [Mycena olivaceomarginata]